MPELPPQVRIRPERTTWLAVALFALTSLPLAGSGRGLPLLLLVPAAAAVWVVRARVVAAPVGIEVCNGLRPHRFAWSDVEGFDLPRGGSPRLVLTDGRRLRMSALDRRQLPRVLAMANAGARLTAPPTAG